MKTVVKSVCTAVTVSPGTPGNVSMAKGASIDVRDGSSADVFAVKGGFVIEGVRLIAVSKSDALEDKKRGV